MIVSMHMFGGKKNVYIFKKIVKLNKYKIFFLIHKFGSGRRCLGAIFCPVASPGPVSLLINQRLMNALLIDNTFKSALKKGGIN